MRQSSISQLNINFTVTGLSCVCKIVMSNKLTVQTRVEKRTRRYKQLHLGILTQFGFSPVHCYPLRFRHKSFCNPLKRMSCKAGILYLQILCREPWAEMIQPKRTCQVDSTNMHQATKIGHKLHNHRP